MTTNNDLPSFEEIEAEFDEKAREIIDALESKAGELRGELHEIEATIEDYQQRLEQRAGKLRVNRAIELIEEAAEKAAAYGTWMTSAEMASLVAEMTGDKRMKSTHVNGVYHAKSSDLLRRKKAPASTAGRSRYLYMVKS